MTPNPNSVYVNSGPKSIRPIAANALYGIVFIGDKLVAIDTARGLLLEIDRETDNTTVLNPYQAVEFVGVTGLAVWEDTLWLTRENSIFFCPNAIKDNIVLPRLNPEHFITLAYPANGIAVWKSTVYVTCQKAGYILVLNAETKREITRFYLPGIGIENITIKDEELWLCDETEQTVYCLDRATGEIKFSVLTPFDSPTGLAFYQNSSTQEEILYVAYTADELYVRDDPNSLEQYQLSKRRRSLIHPLSYYYNEEGCYALSNGYLIEMSYTEEIEPLDSVNLQDVEWRIALPSETDRQKIREIRAVGMPFTEEIQDGERVAVFKFNRMGTHDRYLFGWQAILEVRGIKYKLTPRDVEKIPELPADFAGRYLIDNDNLAMSSELIKKAAKEAVRSETNLLRKLLSIRNYVYDKLDYAVTPKIEPPDVVLNRGVGSCGEYVGLLLALARLNGIACRTIGRYKCPPYPDQQGVLLEPEFNHVWLEFYIPGFGWIPMESNPDDIQHLGPYPLRFFMGLAWYHIEIGKGIRFQSLKSQGIPLNKENISVGNLAINHVRFKILGELSAQEMGD